MNMKLIYVNKVGNDWTGKHIYEFLFSTEIKDVDGDDWDAYPASGRPSPPAEGFVKRVGRLTTEDLKLNLIQESTEFAVWDAVDGVIALAWEDMEGYNEYPEERLAFHFGDDIQSVEDKLYSHDLVLEYNEEIKTITDED
jgi:hypothetical protein